MNANINAKRATIAEIQGKFFEIPPYQRLYEWEKEQIETLLDDMKKAFETNKEKEYFIGNITTSIKSKNEQKIYVLIDGQQRLTTLWFIGFYLASQNCPNWKEFIMQGENLRIAMPIRDNEENALKELAKKIIDGKYKFKQDKDNKIAAFKESSNIHQKIIEAFSCIESRFVNGNDKNIDLANFAKYIYENVCFVFVTLAENTDLNRFFVRMNNRGKQLEKHEILKARVLGEIRKVYDKNNKLKQDESDEIWKKYAKIWDLCSDMDKYIFQSASDRSILKSKSQNENSAESSNNNDSLVKIADIVEKYKIPEANKSKEKDSPSKVESIIDFPTFLLHCLKLQDGSISIAKDKLLDIFDINDEQKWNSESCKKFIESMLLYRVLFDYFVIKNTLGDDGFAIMRFYESNGSYQPKAKSFEDLAMIQNYLRVARQGERQNYHHWLTEFLEFLSINDLQFDEIEEIKKFVDNFLSNKDKNELPKSLVKKESQKDELLTEKLKVLQEKLIWHLEKIDTEQIRNVNLKDKKIGDISKDFLKEHLSNGTNTSHYWFYRLEYYLWKWGTLDETEFKKKFGDNFDNLKLIFSAKLGGHDFKSIAKSFYFRNLNSIEHIQPQSKAGENGWKIHNEGTENQKQDIDCFGNLALLSVGFNSSLSNQDNADKRLDLQKKINKSEVESLKLWLVYANYPKDEDWTYKNAQEHQKTND